MSSPTATTIATPGTPGATATPTASPTAAATASPTATATRTPAVPPLPRGALRDPLNPLLAYRLRGAVVQRSSDGGRHWATLLTPGAPARLRGGGCRPARYRGVAALRVSPLLPGALFIATSGATGPVPRSRRDVGCRAATGGLFIVRPDAAGRPRITGPFVTGLPFAQGAHGRTPRAYALRDVTPDPTNPGAAYVYAVVPGSPGPRSPWPGLFRTPDGGAHWYAATRGLPTVRIGAARGAPAGVLTINPAYGTILYDVVGATIYRSVDRGAHWTAIRAVRARHSVRLFVNPVNPSLLYALSDRGLYHSRDMGRTWLRLLGGHLPSPGRIRTLRFDPRLTSAVLVVPVHGRAVRVVEPRAPAPPGFALAVTFTPINATNVALALHAGPLAAVRIDVVDGTGDPSPTAALATNDGGFGNATIRLIEPVSPAALRVRVAARGQASVVTPWLSPGWTPRGVAPPPTATPTPTSTPTATATPSPTATTAPTFTPLPSPTAALPTPYPASTLDATWAWKPLTSTLPLCSSIPVATSTPTPSPTPTSTSTPTATFTPLPSPSSTASPIGGIAWPGGTSPSPTTTVTATLTVFATPTATSAPAGPCNAGPPAPRFDYAAAWDNADRRLYVFGGSAGKTTLGDLAAYSTITNAWIPLAPALPPVPAPRTGAAAVWDTTDNTLLLFGGAVPGGGLTDEVWSYAPASNTWTQLSANGAAGAPSARTHAAVAWDATNSRLLVFGGETPGLTNDLWSYTPSSNTWAQLSADTGDQSAPPRRSWAQIAWDSGAGVLRLFGGKSRGGGAMSDTWTWSQSGGWSFQALPDQPPGRQAAAYFWDDTHGRFVVGPGPSMPGASTDVWSFDSASNDWLQVPIANAAALPPRQMERMVWDAADNQALLFGGLVGANPANDLWALVPTGAAGPAPTPQPAAHPYVKSVDIGQAVSATSNAVVMHKDVPQEVAGLGATYARVSFAIGANNSAWTQARLHAYEKVIAALSAHGVQTLGLAGLGITHGWSPADWVQNARETTGESGENPAIDDYVRQLGLLVAHFSAPPYNVRRWELVNEPNVSLCPAGTPCANTPALQPSNFAYLLAAAYREIKGNPATAGVELISGGIFAHSIGGAYSRANAGATYIAHTFDEGINHSGGWTAVLHDFGSYPVDAVGVHIYVDQAQRTTPAVIRTYLDWFHAAYAAYDPSAPTSVTEIGWRTSTSEPVESVPPDVQAFNLDTACATASRLGYVDMLSWFQLRDNPSFGNGSTWGLVDRGGNAKPAYGGFKGQGG